MPDLSAYLDFSVHLNYQTGRLVLTDTSAYPGGIGADITGIINCTQPDGIEVTGDFTSPDVVYATSHDGDIELRPDNLGEPQNGIYTITYTVRHPSYSDTTKTKTFTLRYARPQGVIANLFDVFAPNLSFSDDTNYDQDDFSTPVKTRTWNVQVGSAGAVTSSDPSADLQVLGSYYDAVYEATLDVTLLYFSTVYSYLSLTDTIHAYKKTSANTPPTFTTLKEYLKEINERRSEDTTLRRINNFREDYQLASDLLDLIKQRICDNDTLNLYDLVQEFLNIYYNRVSAVYYNTDTSILPYDYSDVDCASGGGSGSGSGGSNPLSFIVGTTAGAPTAGASTWTHSAITTGTRLIRNTTPVATISWNGNAYYTVTGNTITLHGDTFKTDDLLQI